MANRASRRSTIRAGQYFGSWTAVRLVGRGGNGEVWEVEDSSGQKAALKVLTKIKPIAYQRFKDEVQTIKSVVDVNGILPVLDCYLPPKLGFAIPWYTMPLGTPIQDWAEKVLSIEKVRAIAQVATAMSALHSKGIGHRDIKPANLVVCGDFCCVVDFGLVIYPGKSGLTGKDEKIGPLWTMAPEVRRKHNVADPFSGDVYSLAKSLWILITAVGQGFDGQYTSYSDLSIKPFLSGLHTTHLEQLLHSATANNPSDRPLMSEFSARLDAWLKECDDFPTSNPRQWEEMLKQLFPVSYPEHAEWNDLEQIVNVLNLIGKANNLNHLFYPSGGGNDLQEAFLSKHEQGCIEFLAGTWSLVKPKCLSFEGFSSDSEWCYFRLELDTLDPCGVYKQNNGQRGVARIREEVTEINSSIYADYSCWDEFFSKEENFQNRRAR